MTCSDVKNEMYVSAASTTKFALSIAAIPFNDYASLKMLNSAPKYMYVAVLSAKLVSNLKV